MKFVSICFVFLTQYILTNSKLISVHMVIRHGLRAPTSVYPTYPKINETSTMFPRGLSQLTDAGIKQCINIGAYFRDRYSNFYSNDSRNAILLSSNTDRSRDYLAIISNQLWKATTDSGWLAPRIFSAPTQIDYVVYFPSYCPNADSEYNTYLVGTEVAEYNKQNQKLYEIVGNNTGLPVDGVNGLINTVKTFDTLKAIKKNGFEIPNWADVNFNEMANVMTNFFDFYYRTKNGIRLRVGSLLKEISTRMDQAMNSNMTVDRWYKNFFIYNTHEQNIQGLTTAFGIKLSISPPFGSGVIFELHEIENQNIVRVFYLNNTESLPISGVQLTIPSCSVADCPYKTFTSAISAFFPNQKTECGLPDSYDPIMILQQNLTDTAH
jgi:hypothetical protein